MSRDINQSSFPDLTPSSRSGEYNEHKKFKNEVVFEYLFNSRSHRWLDENVLGLNPEESRGYQSMGVLHYIGIKGIHKGYFENTDIQEAINLLENQEGKFTSIINCLKGKMEDERFEDQKLVIDVSETERDLIMKTRIGHGKFKDALLKKSEKCNICNVNDRRFLIASHIKPWSESTNYERLDVNNGLLLCPNHDWVFDKGYISFNVNGSIIISDMLSEIILDGLGIDKNMSVNLNEAQKKYMYWHREKVFKNY